MPSIMDGVGGGSASADAQRAIQQALQARLQAASGASQAAGGATPAAGASAQPASSQLSQSGSVYRRGQSEYFRDATGTEYEVQTNSHGGKYYVKDGNKWEISSQPAATGQHTITDMSQAYSGLLAQDNQMRQITNEKQKYTPELFMKLFMEELTHQDPTKPMDNAKVIEQTSQIAQLEQSMQMKESFKTIVSALQDTQKANKSMAATQTQLVKTLEEMSKGFKTLEGATHTSASNSMLIASTMVGKSVHLKNDTFKFDGSAANINFFVPTPISIKWPGKPRPDGTTEPSNRIDIYDNTGRAVAGIDLTHQDSWDGKAGNLQVLWHGEGDGGSTLPAGDYKAVLKYTDVRGNEHELALGDDIIGSVSFKDGTPSFNLLGHGSVKIDDIGEMV